MGIMDLQLRKTSGALRTFLIMFVISLSFGYASGLYYISISSGFTGKSVEENYLGNEDDEEADTMKFKMKEKEVLSIIHSHVISFALIFLALGLLLFHSSFSTKLIAFLSIEPFISLILSFGAIWLMWKGIDWMQYIVIISGSLMHLVFLTSITLILVDLLAKRRV
jgi:hypothetical protein